MEAWTNNSTENKSQLTIDRDPVSTIHLALINCENYVRLVTSLPASSYKMIKYVFNKLHSFYKIKCAGIIHCAPAWIAQNTVYLGVRLRSRGLSKLHYPAPASSSQLYVTHFAARDS